MLTFRDAKAMAKTLRESLCERNIDLSHSACLEIVARQFGLADWNTLAARLERTGGKMLSLPEGWTVSGSRSEDYEMGVDDADRSGAALIRCRYAAGDPAFGDKTNGFGTLMQSLTAEAYRGKRIRLGATLRTEAVDGAATLWMRVDGRQVGPLAFDNMETRSVDGVLRGTTGWSVRRIVLDVPEDAESIHFGFYLRGTGTVWGRGFELAEVGHEIAVTDGTKPGRSAPVNLDFAKRLPPRP